jgi:hypothetical protein
MITIHKGKTAFKIAPNPADVFYSQVLNPLLNAKLRILKMIIVFFCYGGAFIHEKQT